MLFKHSCSISSSPVCLIHKPNSQDCRHVLQIHHEIVHLIILRRLVLLKTTCVQPGYPAKKEGPLVCASGNKFPPKESATSTCGWQKKSFPPVSNSVWIAPQCCLAANIQGFSWFFHSPFSFWKTETMGKKTTYQTS